MTILGIETSCDETAIAIIDGSGSVKDGNIEIQVLSNVVCSQAKLHEKYGGVFPSLAKREHIKNLPIILDEAMKVAGISKEKPAIDLIAVTEGPGLEPCLWTGITFAEGLAKKWGVPVLPVNHMEGHIFSALLTSKSEPSIFNFLFSNKTRKRYTLNAVQFPAISLLISGGHTELVLMKDWFSYEYIGRTRDDAVGEAYDKTARLLGLPYPGGPEISRLARMCRENPPPNTRAGLPEISLPRPMINSDDFDFSFSGLKTAVLYLTKKIGVLDDTVKKLIAQEFEYSVSEVLSVKAEKAILKYGAKQLIVGGGVAANDFLREKLKQKASQNGARFSEPDSSLYTDNALMIASVAMAKSDKVDFAASSANISAKGNLAL